MCHSTLIYHLAAASLGSILAMIFGLTATKAGWLKQEHEGWVMLFGIFACLGASFVVFC